MISNLRIVHPPSSDNPTNLSVLLLSIDTQKYIFNLPEGTTRTLAQHGTKKKSSLRNVFLPRVGIQECGGLPGFIMGLADANWPALTIHGPPVLTHFLSTCRSYLKRDNIAIQVKETPLSESFSSGTRAKDITFVVYQDQNITVKAIPLLPLGFHLPSRPSATSPEPPSKRQRSTPDDTPWSPTLFSKQALQLMFPNDAKEPAMEIDEKQVEEMAKLDLALSRRLKARTEGSRQALGAPPLKPTPLSSNANNTEQAPSLLYIVQGKDLRGKLDVEKATSMGVPTNSILAALTRGEDVEVSRPKAWETYSAKERSQWVSKITFTGPKSQARAPKKSVKTKSLSQMDEVVETEKVMVKSSDVMGPSKPGFIFLQIYLPSIEYLDSFLQDSTQAALQFAGNQPHTIIHAVHPVVLEDKRYRAFIHRFKTTHHIISSRPFLPDRSLYPSSTLANLRLSHLNKDLYPPPSYSLEPELKLSDIGLAEKFVHLPMLDTSISLYPPGAPTRYDELGLDLDAPINSEKVKRLASYEEIAGRKEVKEKVRAARKEAYARVISQAKKSNEVMTNGHVVAETQAPLKLTTLGTGSSLPSKYRNVSSTLIHLPGNNSGYIILDAGESTYAQLERKFGRGVDDVLSNVHLIFLSHIHADHHMGITRLLIERAKLNVNRPLFIVASSFIRKYLEEVDQIFSLGISNDVNTNGVIFFDSEELDTESGVERDVVAHPILSFEVKSDDDRWKEELVKESIGILERSGKDSNNESRIYEISQRMYHNRIARRKQVKALRQRMTQQLHGTQVFTTEVDHRAKNCYGIVFRGKEWSGAYSGDTRPCSNLVKAGKGVEFLLHEATIDDSLPDVAHMKGHSTFGQAIEIAKQMQVKFVVLTHFSQRYPRLPKLNATEDLGDLKVGIAFDLLTMQMGDLEKMMEYRGALESLFEVDVEGDEEGEAEAGNEPSDGKEPIKALPASASKQEDKGKSRPVEGFESGESGPRLDDDMSALAADGQKNGTERRLFQRKFIKSHEFQYISFHLIPSSRQPEANTPSCLSIARAIETSLTDLNGIVNGSFNWDLLHIQPQSGGKKAVRVVLKVPSSHVEAMRASLSAGVVVQSDNVTFHARYDRTLSSLDLTALETDNSRQWFESIVKEKRSSDHPINF